MRVRSGFLIAVSTIILVLTFVWFQLVLKGKRFALRDQLHKADAIVVLAGTRGNIKFLHDKIRKAVQLYQEGWAPSIICSGKLSAKVTETPTLIPLAELEAAADQGRIQKKDIPFAEKTWDIALGACYMRDQAIQMGVPPEAVLIENDSLHTRESAEMVLTILREHNMRQIILVTSPFHQLRSYLAFLKALQPYNIKIINYYADTGEWHPLIWFLSKANRKLVKTEIKNIKLCYLNHLLANRGPSYGSSAGSLVNDLKDRTKILG